MFEISFFGERGVISLENHGQTIVLDEIGDEDVYGSYKKLKRTRIKLGTADLSISNVYDAIADGKASRDFTDNINVWHTISQIENAYMKTI